MIDINSPTGTKRVLCVEDNPDICELVAAVLTDCKVISASGVADAWKHYEEQKFSLIVLDYHLEDGSGLDFCRELRAVDPLTPIVFITSDPDLSETDVKLAGGQKLLDKSEIDFLDLLLDAVSTYSVLVP